MRKLLLAGLVLSLAACSSGTKGDKEEDSTAKTTDTTAQMDTPAVGENPRAVSSVCFVNTQGKDSTTVELVVKGNEVTGQMNWLPSEKDARKGKLTGKMDGDIIRATWSFMQEGVTDTLGVVFLLKDNTLGQKPLKLNKKTGREQTDETADFTVKYKPHPAVKK